MQCEMLYSHVLVGERMRQKTDFFPHELRCFYCISVTETALLHIAHTAKKKTHPQCQ